jgi:alkanesulfonate monooxygenase SsuD/methylene tetrahydromethanopterin reductase-like flavin-dependent oxidoreductase (luciferase family)
MRTPDPSSVSFGYLLPTRDAVTLGQPAAMPLIELGVRAEALGFDAVWVGDGPLARARHDALLMLAALAARTERVTLATGVLLAEGRLLLGLGAGFPFPETERQFQAVGVPYAGRIGRLTETIAALRALWSEGGGPVTFQGNHIELEEVALEPPPHRPGGPPIWLAGAGEAAEQRVGRLADGWLPYLPSAEQYAEGWARVTTAAADAGRPAPVPGLYATVSLDASAEVAQERLRRNIERYYELPLELVQSIQAMYAGTPEGLREWLDPYVRAGARHVVLRVSDEQAERGLEAAAAAIPDPDRS